MPHRIQNLGLLLIVCVMSLGSIAANATAQTAIDYVQPRVDRTQFQKFIASFGIHRDERMIIELTFEDYLTSVNELIDRTDEAAEAAGRSRVQAARSGRLRLDRETLAELRADVLNAYRSSWDEAEQLFTDLVERVTFMVPSDVDTEEALRTLRRRVFLHPLQAQRTGFEYAGEGIDLIELVRTLRDEGSPLADLPEESLDALLTQYAAQLDTMILDLSRMRRDAQFDARIARLTNDDDALRDAETRLMSLWARQNALHDSVVNGIATLAEQHVGADARATWVNTYHEACFPWLFREQKPDREYSWLLRNSLSDDERSAIDAAYEAFRRDRFTVADSIIELVRRARLELGRALHPGLDSRELDDRTIEDLHLRMLRLTGDLEAAERRASDAFAEALTPELRSKLRRTVR